MTIKNNDDVAHLLDATGRVGTPYREFEGSSDQSSAPLIDAVFGKGPLNPDQAETPLGIGSDPSNDLLDDVFDRARGIGSGRPVDYGERRDDPTKPLSMAKIRAAALTSMGAARSLDDIRRIITQPVDQTAKSPSTDSLNGLFDRLAG